MRHREPSWINLTLCCCWRGYSVVIIAVSLFGGWLPSIFRLTHTRTQMVTSFVAGVILCVALYYLLPHAMIEIPGERSAETAVWWMLVGTVLMVVLLRVFSFHQHDFSHEEDGSRDQAHDHTHDQHEHGHVAVNPMSWAGIALGLGLHTVTEGVTLGTSNQGRSSRRRDRGVEPQCVPGDRAPQTP